MNAMLSAVAVAQNSAFITAIKNTETCRDRPLQITHRVGGGITIEGYRSVRFSVLLPIFMQYGKQFTITFGRSNTSSVRIDCFESVEHIIPPDIDSIGTRAKLAETLCVVLNGQIQNRIRSGSVSCLSFSLNKLDYKTALSVYQHPMILDLVIWPDKTSVEIIEQSDNRGGLSYLAHTQPEVFRRKCSRKTERPMSSQNTIKHARVMKGKKNTLKKSFFASLPWN